MGRQLQICTSIKDDEQFHSFFTQNFDCMFFQSFARTKEELTINGFTDNPNPVLNKILIWNQQFNWEPTYKQTITKEKLFYIDNAGSAPLIEFTKTNWNNFEQGRIYWSKDFSGPVQYDVKEFEIFFNSITKWIKRNSNGKVRWANCNIYFLQEAWKIYNERK
jgi:hypothetical protein